MQQKTLESFLFLRYVFSTSFGLVAILNKHCLAGDYDILQIDIVLSNTLIIAKEGISPLHFK